MSGVLEKTFSGLVNSILGPAGTKNSVSQGLVGVPGLKGVSLGLVHFVEKLQAARKISKQEEEHCVEHESKQWIKLLSSPSVNGSLVADILCRALIAQVRGYPIPSILIHAIKLTQSSDVQNKRIGYLFVSQSLGPGSELTLLLVNTVQRDLAAPNVLQVAAALATLPTIITTDLAPAIIMPLTHCLAHQQSYIRRRAATMVGMVAARCGEDVVDGAGNLVPHLLHLLTDHDPGVALAAIMSLSKIYKVSGQEKFDLRDQVARSASHMLFQAVNGALPREYQVNALPAPFVQIQMLRVIQCLSDKSWQPPKEVTEALELLIGQPWGGKEIALYSVLLECVFTITSLPHHDGLVTSTLKIVLGFLKSTNVDLKYIGLRALASVFAVLEEALTPSHLEAVLDCLYHTDQNLQSKTLKLLCAMANSHNYQAVCTTLLEFSARTKDQATHKVILLELATIIDKYCKDAGWCVELLSPLFLSTVSPDKKLTDAVVHVLQLGFSEDQKFKASVDASQELLLKMFSKGSYSLIDVNLIASVLNLQFANDAKLVSKYFTDSLLDKLIHEKNLNERDVSIFECLKNIGLNDPTVRTNIIAFLHTYVNNTSNGLAVRELASETCLWLQDAELSLQVLKNQERILNQTIEVDLTLSFLDEYVIESLESGAMPFKPFSVSMSNTALDEKLNSDLQETQLSCSTIPSTGSEDAHSSAPSTSTHLTVGTATTSSLMTRSVLPNKTVWSTEGRIRQKSEGESSLRAELTSNAPGQPGNLLGQEEEEDEDVTEGSVEMADEAQEDEKTKNIDESSLQRSQLTQALLAGLGMARSKQ